MYTYILYSWLMYYIKLKARNTSLLELSQHPIENHRNRVKIDIPNTHLDDRSLPCLPVQTRQ